MKNKLLLCVMSLVLCLSACGNGSGGKDASGVDGSVPSDMSTPPDTTTAEESEYTADIDENRMSYPVSSKEKKDAKMTEFIEIASYKNCEHVPTQENSMLKIDFEGKIDGKAVEGMSAEDYDLTLGSGTFIEGFEEALMGHYEGDTVNFKLKFPDPYSNNEELSGKEADWTVKIKEYYNEGYFILQEVEKNSKYKSYPKDDYDEISDYIYDYYVQMCENGYGIKLEEFVQLYKIDLNQIVDGNLKDLVAAEAIMEKEGITEESPEYESAVKKLLEANEVSSLEEAKKNDIPDVWIHITVARRVAYDVIEKYMSGESANPSDESVTAEAEEIKEDKSDDGSREDVSTTSEIAEPEDTSKTDESDTKK